MLFMFFNLNLFVGLVGLLVSIATIFYAKIQKTNTAVHYAFTAVFSAMFFYGSMSNIFVALLS